MASKRIANDSDIPAENPKRRSQNTTEETILKDGDFSRIEAIIQQAVRAEFASAQHQQSPSQFQQEFISIPKQEYYTHTKIVAAEDAPVQIVLRDVGSQFIVTEGPMSSSEIEICVLPGDFGTGDNGRQNWSSEEFNANIIVRPREGRTALLKGKTKITLKDGVASIDKLEFTDISRWIRSGKFRLAGRSKEANVREAISEPFTVKDKRGMPIMKHAQPCLKSEIWRLRHIARGKKYHKQLSDDGIKTVGDFLRLYTTNPSWLKEKFGSIGPKKWDDIVENARDCVIDDNVHYVYQATERVCLVFNSIYEVVMVSFDGNQTYRRSQETFTSAEKRLVEVARKEAYQNVNCFVKVNLEEILAIPPQQSSNGGGALAPPQVDLPAATQVHQGQGIDDSDLLGDSFLFHYSPSSFTWLDDLHYPLQPHGGRRSGAVWSKIRAYLKWLVLRRSLCR